MSPTQARKSYKTALRIAQQEHHNPDEVLKLLTEAANAGNGDAAAAIGSWYVHGKHVKKNARKAVEWFLKAADAGNAEGFYGIAGAYEQGIGGLKKDERKAFEYYVRAALAGETFAFQEVARCYLYGIGVSSDEALGRIWLKQANDLGSSPDPAG
jgi:uncharacterized protein